MVVSADAVDGTIGGGHLEFTATAIARDMLAGATRSPANELRRFPLGASLGQCCGGVVNLLFEPVDAVAVSSIGMPWCCSTKGVAMPSKCARMLRNSEVRKASTKCKR